MITSQQRKVLLGEVVRSEFNSRSWDRKLSEPCGIENCPNLVGSKIAQTLWERKLSKPCGIENFPNLVGSKIFQTSCLCVLKDQMHVH